ncbi:MAG: hypothetical protein H0X45_10840 [Planctomycetes bacterium]|nr:hypothetical protein [Planctomycetota bacterium]
MIEIPQVLRPTRHALHADEAFPADDPPRGALELAEEPIREEVLTGRLNEQIEDDGLAADADHASMEHEPIRELDPRSRREPAVLAQHDIRCSEIRLRADHDIDVGGGPRHPMDADRDSTAEGVVDP